MNVEWDGAACTVAASGDGVNATVPVDSKMIFLNGNTIPVDVSAESKNSRMMMSIANLGTALAPERDGHTI